MQAKLNGRDKPPSVRVIEEHVALFGRDYRLETEGPHPVYSLRETPTDAR
jgi:hypothetical protein